MASELQLRIDFPSIKQGIFLSLKAGFHWDDIGVDIPVYKGSVLNGVQLIAVSFPRKSFI